MFLAQQDIFLEEELLPIHEAVGAVEEALQMVLILAVTLAGQEVWAQKSVTLRRLVRMVLKVLLGMVMGERQAALEEEQEALGDLVQLRDRFQAEVGQVQLALIMGQTELQANVLSRIFIRQFISGMQRSTKLKLGFR
jgi:cob(I)alamin adenosyltransferase